jgi:hypothetical protein
MKKERASSARKPPLEEKIRHGLRVTVGRILLVIPIAAVIGVVCVPLTRTVYRVNTDSATAAVAVVTMVGIVTARVLMWGIDVWARATPSGGTTNNPLVESNFIRVSAALMGLALFVSYVTAVFFISGLEFRRLAGMEWARIAATRQFVPMFGTIAGGLMLSASVVVMMGRIWHHVGVDPKRAFAAMSELVERVILACFRWRVEHRFHRIS